MFEFVHLLTFGLTPQWKIYLNSLLQSIDLSIKELNIYELSMNIKD